MKSIGAEVGGDCVSTWMIAASPLAVHVQHYGRRFPEDTSCDDLFILPFSLISLRCAVDLSPPASRLSLGSSLQSLRLQLVGDANTAADINDAIVTVSQLPFLEELDLWLPLFFPEVSFAPLASAPQLTVFRCSTPDNDDGQPTHPQLDQLRMLFRLHTLDVNLSGVSLIYLLRAPHALQWQQIHRLIIEIDDELAAALSNLPTLTKLEAYSCRSVAFLPALLHLRTLTLDMVSDVHLAADIVAGLSSCSQLTDLSVQAADVTSQHLSQALSHLPQLRNWHTGFCYGLFQHYVHLTALDLCPRLSRHSLPLTPFLIQLHACRCRNEEARSRQRSHSKRQSQETKTFPRRSESD